MDHMFLILMDAHSKWLDVHLMQSITSANTIEKLPMVFATHGLPSKFLFTYRITPYTTIGIAPAQLLMNCRPRSRFDHLFLDLCVQKKQAKQAASHNSKLLWSFKVGDLVFTKIFSSTPLIWIPGNVAKVTGPLSYHIELGDGRIVHRHVDAVCPRLDSADPLPLNDSSLSQDDLYLPTRALPPAPTAVCPVPPVHHSTRSRSHPNYYGH